MWLVTWIHTFLLLTNARAQIGTMYTSTSHHTSNQIGTLYNSTSKNNSNQIGTLYNSTSKNNSYQIGTLYTSTSKNTSNQIGTLYNSTIKNTHIINQPGSEICTGPGTSATKLELVFLIDQSSQNVLQQMPRVINIVDDISHVYPGSKFGIASFADFACLVYMPKQQCDAGYESTEEPVNGIYPEYHKDPEGCYRFNTALTTDTQSIKTAVQQHAKLEFLPSGDGESGHAGIFLTAAERKMMWTRGISSTTKIIFVITDDQTREGKLGNMQNFKSKLELKGDGTDRCSTMHNPDSTQIGDILGKDGMCVFVLWADTAYTTGIDTHSSWNKALKELKSPYTLVRLDKTNADIFGQLDSFINDTCHITSKTFPCFDPPMYNTLGL